MYRIRACVGGAADAGRIRWLPIDRDRLINRQVMKRCVAVRWTVSDRVGVLARIGPRWISLVSKSQIRRLPCKQSQRQSR